MKTESQNVENLIIGKWECINGDYGLISEFKQDGTLIQHIGSATFPPRKYIIDGKFLVVFVEQPDGSIFEQKEQFSIVNDVLTFIFTPRTKRHYKRIE